MSKITFNIYSFLRPFFKVSSLIIKLKENKNIKIRVICSGQHKDMIKPIMEIFDIEEDLILPNERKTNFELCITETIKKLDEEFDKYKPDLILVQGDIQMHLQQHFAHLIEKLRLGHIEAGLRTNNLSEPFPEEGKQKTISQISQLHFILNYLKKIL